MAPPRETMRLGGKIQMLGARTGRRCGGNSFMCNSFMLPLPRTRTPSAAAGAHHLQNARRFLSPIPHHHHRSHQYHHHHTLAPSPHLPSLFRSYHPTLLAPPLRFYTTPVISLSLNPLRSYSAAVAASPPMADENLIESAKRAAAIRAVEDHFDPNATYVGIGSGTTIIYVVDAIKERSTNPNIGFVPTGFQSRQVILKAGLTPVLFDSLPENAQLDVAFDGADEVDDELNCIKGGGACLFQEKLVAERAKKFICVADYRKAQPRLLTKWPTIPIEVAPIAIHTVEHTLRSLGSPNPVVRENVVLKAGPLKTDQSFYIIDAPFPTLLTAEDVAAGVGAGKKGKWEVNELSKAIKSITGVLEVGIFCGLNGLQAQEKGLHGGQRPVAVYFGMEDGSVQMRTAKSG